MIHQHPESTMSNITPVSLYFFPPNLDSLVVVSPPLIVYKWFSIGLFPITYTGLSCFFARMCNFSSGTSHYY